MLEQSWREVCDQGQASQRSGKFNRQPTKQLQNVPHKTTTNEVRGSKLSRLERTSNEEGSQRQSGNMGSKLSHVVVPSALRLLGMCSLPAIT